MIHGTLSAAVWPTHAGAVDTDGAEPLPHLDYRRGQITWTVNPAGVLVGQCRILVPAGTYTHIIYSHHPYRPAVTVQRLTVPFTFTSSGWIDLGAITETDVRPLAPDPVLHD